MAKDAFHTSHFEGEPSHEAQLTGAIALASLFSSCVEAFGLIHPLQKWEKSEQLLLTRLGLQQARLLIWGMVVGVTSPPASVTDRAIPRHPNPNYPDISEPTYFGPRDARLDEPEARTIVEQTLSAIVDRSSGATREEMMGKYGLKVPKRFGSMHEVVFDMHRLEAFRERYELLREVAESYAQINTRRNNSIVHTNWQIADVTKFGNFIKLTEDKVDFLIDYMGVKEQVDRAMRMDIRIFGWHIVPDRVRAATDISKLRLLQEICKKDYPVYTDATQQALDNIMRETRENNTFAQTGQPAAIINGDGSIAPLAEHHAHAQHQKTNSRQGILKFFKGFGKGKDATPPSTSTSSFTTPAKPSSRSFSGPSSAADDGIPLRSQSDTPAVDRMRSKSIGGEIGPLDDDLVNKLEKITSMNSEAPSSVHLPSSRESVPVPVVMSDLPLPGKGNGGSPVIVRHDQYHGIARTETRDLHQGDY